MRPLFRLITLGIATVVLALAGATSVLAASAPTSVSLDASFCTPDSAIQYCYEISGTLRFQDTAAGSTAQVNRLTKTTAYANGVVVGRAISATSGRSVFRADGTVVFHTVVTTHSTLGGEPCQYRLVIRFVDYEPVVDHEDNGCL